MKHVKQKIIIIMLMAIATMFLSACLRITADELYSLPQVSEEYLKLQRHLNAVLNQGAEFAPPTTGPNRQAVQLVDINGDSINEVIAFFKLPGDSPLKVYIFKNTGNDYVEAEVISGEGAEFDSVRYVDMDGDGVSEIIIGRKMGDTLKHMSIYSIKDFNSVLLTGEEYTGITIYDLNGDFHDDIITLRLSQEAGAVARVFSLMRDGEIVKAETRLSSRIETISRVLAGKLIDGTPAIFVESEGKYDEGTLVTDICIYKDGSFDNISLKRPSGISEGTVRQYYQSADINKNGIIKVPMPKLLKAQSDTPYHAVDWYAYDCKGRSSLALTTYHNNNDGWFLILPFDWRGKVTVRREDAVSGERTIVFSYFAYANGPYEDFLKIHKLTGDNAEERSALPNRSLLMSDGAAVYAFELLVPPNSFGLTLDETLIKDNFRLIYSDWLMGTI